jgi:hypothetical protein
MGSMKCMQEGCTVDSYALYPVIAGFDGFCKKSIMGKIFCHRTSDVSCNADIACEVDIQYNKHVKSKPSISAQANTKDLLP